MAVSVRQNSVVMITEDSMYAEFNCGSADDLAELATWGDCDLVDGCVALVIPYGAFYVLYDGTWYNSDGSDAPTPEVSANLNASSSMLGKSPTLAKAVADSDGEYIDMTEPEVDAIRDELEGGEDDADVL
jgi:hypothetical protein